MNFLEWIIRKLIRFGHYAGGMGWMIYWTIGMVLVAIFELCSDTFILLPLYLLCTVLFWFQKYIRNLYKQYKYEVREGYI